MVGKFYSMTTQAPEKLFTAKELAAELRRGYRFVQSMRARGFVMPGGTATLTEARDWLRANPRPCRGEPVKQA